MIATTELGPFTVTAIEDGFWYRDAVEWFQNSTPEGWEGTNIDSQGRLRVPFGCFLVESPNGALMVDTGVGVAPSPLPIENGGALMDALSQRGVDRSDVAVVIHTHLHPDHTGGNLVEGEPAFPEARWWVHRGELSYWEEPDRSDAVQARYQPLLERGLVEQVDGETEVLAGVRVVETFGHTPGHLSVVLSAGKDLLFIAGDVTHHPRQVEHPEWRIPADVDGDQAEATRRRVFASLAGSDVLLGAGHYPKSGFGRINHQGANWIYEEA